MLFVIVQSLVTNAEMVLVGPEPTNASQYATQVTWLDTRPQPTWEQIQTARPTVEHAQAVANVQQQRHSAYVAESDPLYFLWQRGEGTQADWLAAVADIRTRFLMPDA